VTQRDYAVFLDPVIAAIDALIAARSDAAQSVGDAKEFLEFKVYATLHIGDQIREQLPAAASALSREGDSFNVTFDHGARFALFLLVDSFLFEAGSIRDAVAQLANAAFAIGVATDDTRLADKVRHYLKPDGTKETDLEAWFEDTAQPDWLRQLLRLRNATTHRHVVRLPVQFRWKDYGASWMSSIHVEAGEGKYEPLLEFIDRTEKELCALLVKSLKCLAEVKSPVR